MLKKKRIKDEAVCCDPEEGICEPCSLEESLDLEVKEEP